MDHKEQKEKKHEGCCAGDHHHERSCCGEHEHEPIVEACGCDDEACFGEEPITLDLMLDDGSEVQCEVVGIFEVEGKEYIALLPENDENVLLYHYSERYSEEEGEDDLILDNIEDEQEFQKVSETFWEIFGDGEWEEE